MSTRDAIIDIIDIVPQKILDEIYHYAAYLKSQSEKDARNAEYVEKIKRGIAQCAEGRGLVRDIVEVADVE